MTTSQRLTPLQEWKRKNMTEAMKEDLLRDLQWTPYTMTTRINLTSRWTFDEIRTFEMVSGCKSGTILSLIPQVLIRLSEETA